MSRKKLRVIVLTHGGVEQAVRRLTELDCAEVAGVFVETDVVARRGLGEKIKRSVRYDGYAVTAAKLARKLLGLRGIYDGDIEAITGGRDRLREVAAESGVPIHFVASYHGEDALALMRGADADLGVVLGTNILKQSVFNIPRLGSINLHQGLAPYYRGCPPVFWELFNGEREVGLTVHFVAGKVDTGDIILQRAVPLEYDYSYGLDYERFITDYRRKLVVPCANLVAEAVRAIAEGSAAPRPQDTGLGKRYRMPVHKEKAELRRRLRERRRALAGYGAAQRVGGGDCGD
jgi:folate-dependent phosphoribosylglycinamide formyltransferase PurN